MGNETFFDSFSKVLEGQISKRGDIDEKFEGKSINHLLNPISESFPFVIMECELILLVTPICSVVEY